MNDFDSILTRLSLQLDDQLTSSERQRLDADMAAHPETAAMTTAFRQVDGMLRYAPHVAPLHDLSALIMARIEKDKRVPRSLIGAMVVLAGTLSLWPALVVGTTLFLIISTLLRPGTWRFVAESLVSALNALYAMSLTWSTVNGALAPWVLPLAAATIGLAALTLTLNWAKRTDLHYQTAGR